MAGTLPPKVTLKQFMVRRQVLSLYRNILRACREVPGEKNKTDMRDWVRSDFRKNMYVTDEVNSLAAELLYEAVLDEAAPNAMTTLLDICCGAGALAVLASSRMRGVVGIESVYSAVRDARAHVITNGCSNVEIIPGLAEKKLPRVAEELDSAPDIVAVINPGRGGVGHQVIQAIRECNRIERVVYVSCDAEGAAVKNFVQLCAPSEHKKNLSTIGGGSAPFSLTRAVQMDIFPHTANCDMVL